MVKRLKGMQGEGHSSIAAMVKQKHAFVYILEADLIANDLNRFIPGEIFEALPGKSAAGTFLECFHNSTILHPYSTKSY